MRNTLAAQDFKIDRVSVDSDMSDDYNIFIEFLEDCTRKNTIRLLPTIAPYSGKLSEYSEKYLQKRAWKVA